MKGKNSRLDEKATHRLLFEKATDGLQKGLEKQGFLETRSVVSRSVDAHFKSQTLDPFRRMTQRAGPSQDLAPHVQAK